MLIAGTRVGPYEIDSRLGEGGMGVVYRARDTKLARQAAIKVLPDFFAVDPDRLARFQREAQVLASLNHPNIAQVYGLEESGASQCIAMELIEGDTLSQRIARGPIPIDEALEIARQVAEALDAAHQKGVVHRDLKPANIKIAPDGTVKVLDFGLAKIFHPDSSESVIANSPTMISRTGSGVLMGTAAYMSPEQARGRAVDRSTDIWALGCLLYEMLCGKLAFDGETMTDILGGIVKSEPDWNALPKETPSRMIWIIRRCMQKNPKERLQNAADVRILLKDVASESGEQKPAKRRSPARTAVLAVGAGLLIAAIGAGVGALALRPAASPNQSAVVRMAIPSPTGEFNTIGPTMALSPDGTQLVFTVGGQLYLRNLDSLDVQSLGPSGTYPFFSSDGKWIGFSLEARMKKIPVTGGVAQPISDIRIAGPGASWGSDDTIYYSPTGQSGLFKVAASGSDPQPVTTLDRAKGEVSHRWPQILPGGKALLFTVWTGPGSAERQTQLQILETGERRVIAQGSSLGRYVPSGHVVYLQAGQLTAVPFDLVTLKTTGSPIPLSEIVRPGAEGAAFAVSNTGTLAYIPGNPETSSQLVWVDRNGKSESLLVLKRNYSNPVLSPDGRHAALVISDDVQRIWIYDFARKGLTPLTTGDASSQAPMWTHDGKRLAYRATRKGSRNLYWKAVDGSGDEERLTTSDNNQTPGSFSSDGKWLAYTEDDPVTGADLWVLPLDGERKPQPFLNTPKNENNPRFSPDGHWIAYESNESGKGEIYVRPFPGPGEKFSISVDGGNDPVWSRDGRELFYTSGRRMMAVDIRTQPRFSAGTPKKLYEGLYNGTGTGVSGFDAALDGRHLRVERTGPEPTATQLNIVVNWIEELKKLAARK